MLTSNSILLYFVRMLIKSISGIRGTIGGVPGEALTPPDVVKFATGYALWVKEDSGLEKPVVVIGRDARMSGTHGELACVVNTE